MDSKNIHDFGKSSGVQNITFTDSNKIKSTFTDSEKFYVFEKNAFTDSTKCLLV
jgi:hypothetical protein